MSLLRWPVAVLFSSPYCDDYIWYQLSAFVSRYLDKRAQKSATNSAGSMMTTDIHTHTQIHTHTHTHTHTSRQFLSRSASYLRYMRNEFYAQRWFNTGWQFRELVDRLFMVYCVRGRRPSYGEWNIPYYTEHIHLILALPTLFRFRATNNVHSANNWFATL